MEIQNITDKFHTGSGRLWNQILPKKSRTTPNLHVAEKIRHRSGMDGGKLSGIGNRLELTIPAHNNINPKLYKPSTPQIATTHKPKSQKLTIKLKSTNLRCKNTTHRPKSRQKTTPPIQHHPFSTICRDTNILRNRSGNNILVSLINLISVQ